MRRGSTGVPRYPPTAGVRIPEQPPFRRFMEDCFGWKWLPEMYDPMFDLLENNRRAVIVSPHRTGKSELVMAHTIWKQGWPHPEALNQRTLVVSSRHGRAKEQVSWTRNQITSNAAVRRYIPQIRQVTDPNIVENWTGHQFTIDRPDITLDAPSWIGTAVGATYTGSGASRVVLDDIHSFRSVLTELSIKRTVESVLSEKMSRLDAGGQAIAISSAWDERDFQFKMAFRGWPVLVFTVLPEMEGTPVIVNGQDLGVKRILIEDHPNWTEERVAMEMREKGSRIGQMMLGSDPSATAAENPVFNAELLDSQVSSELDYSDGLLYGRDGRVMVAVDVVRKPPGAVRSLGIDPAGGEKGGSAWGFVVTEAVGDQVRYPFCLQVEDLEGLDALRMAVELWRTLECDTVRVEDNFAPQIRQMLQDTGVTSRWLSYAEAKQLAQSTAGVHVGKDKEERLARLALLVEHNRTRFPASVGGLQLVAQMKVYRAGGHPGDLLSAASIGQDGLAVGGGLVGGETRSREWAPGKVRR